MFRASGPSAFDGYVISGLLYFLAMLGAYLLARQMMNPWLAILPAISYGVAPMVVEWGGVIYSDVEGVALASLGLAVFAYASKVEEKGYLFLIGIPLLFLAPLTRYALGIIFIPALVFLLVSGRTLRVLRSGWLYAGLGLAILMFMALSIDWIGYPLSHGYNLRDLVPAPQALNPFLSPQGHRFFFDNFATFLGHGFYGYLIAAAFVVSATFALFLLFFRRASARAI